MRIKMIHDEHMPNRQWVTYGKEYEAVSIEENDFVSFYEIVDDIGRTIVVTDNEAKEV